MRISYLLILLNCWFVSCIYAQTRGTVPTITIDVQNKPLRYILTELEKQSGFFFRMKRICWMICLR